jgi:hypothetical protein
MMTVHRWRVWPVAVLICSMSVGALRAQNPFGLTLSMAPIPVQVSQDDGTAATQFSGTSLGGMVNLSWRIWRLDMRYLEGGLSSDSDLPDEDIVEGELMFGVAPFSWLTVKIGPHIRSFVTPRGTERWAFWEARVGTAAKLGSPHLVTYFEAWHVIASDVDAIGSYDSGNGLEGGIRLSLSRLPFYGEFAYRIDQSKLADGAATHTVEQLVFAIGWMVRR